MKYIIVNNRRKLWKTVRYGQKEIEEATEGELKEIMAIKIIRLLTLKNQE